VVPQRARQCVGGGEHESKLGAGLDPEHGRFDGSALDVDHFPRGRFRCCGLDQPTVERTAEQPAEASPARCDGDGVIGIELRCEPRVEIPGHIDPRAASKARGHTDGNGVHGVTVAAGTLARMGEAGFVETGDLRVAAVVLAAGSSRRLGEPKQLLPFRGATLLDATLDRVRSFGLSQTIVALGGAAPEVRETVDLTGCCVVDSAHHTEGCSSSIVAALAAIDAAADGFLLFLGDQPDVGSSTVEALLTATATEIAVVGYRNGAGHPFWFARSVFDALRGLHGDKAVWKLLESGLFESATVAVDADVPLDVDTRDDYDRLLAAEALRSDVS